MSRCLDPQTPPEKAFRCSKHLFTRYLEDFGRLGYIAHLISISIPYPMPAARRFRHSKSQDQLKPKGLKLYKRLPSLFAKMEWDSHISHPVNQSTINSNDYSYKTNTRLCRAVTPSFIIKFRIPHPMTMS